MANDLPVGAALIRASTAVSDLYEQASAAVGLTSQQARLLFILARKPTNMLGLRSALRLSESTLRGVVDRLETAGLIVRSTDAYDRRRLVVGPTAAGARKALDFENELKARVVDLLAALDPAEQKMLASLLTPLVARAEAVTELTGASN